MMDSYFEYLIDSKESLETVERAGKQWDVFISAFNDSERVRKTFNRVRARRKVWLALPEYKYSLSEIPLENGVSAFAAHEPNEADFVINTFGEMFKSFGKWSPSRICIDITGLMRPHILFILRYLSSCGICSFDMLYTEPGHYKSKEETKFTIDDVFEVRQVSGFEGNHSADMLNDVLIIGVGYDHNLISRVILNKESSRLIQLHSLPSLSADMYQESILRLSRVSSAPSNLDEALLIFSSANDPYVTAAVLSDAVKKLNEQRTITNIYLSPLATKPQALGFGLFFLRELQHQPASIIFPFASKYERETSKGVGRSWVYPVFI